MMVSRPPTATLARSSSDRSRIGGGSGSSRAIGPSLSGPGTGSSPSSTSRTAAATGHVPADVLVGPRHDRTTSGCVNPPPDDTGARTGRPESWLCHDARGQRSARSTRRGVTAKLRANSKSHRRDSPGTRCANSIHHSSKYRGGRRLAAHDGSARAPHTRTKGHRHGRRGGSATHGLRDRADRSRTDDSFWTVARMSSGPR
jgi:hypothetical protein